MNLPDLTTAVALIAAFIGSAGLAGVIKVLLDGKQAAEKHDLEVQQSQIDNLVTIIDQLQDENKRLSDRVAVYENGIITLRHQVHEQSLKIESLERKDIDSQRQIDILRRELKKAQRHISNLVVENEKLQSPLTGGRP